MSHIPAAAFIPHEGNGPFSVHQHQHNHQNTADSHSDNTPDSKSFVEKHEHAPQNHSVIPQTTAAQDYGNLQTQLTNTTAVNPELPPKEPYDGTLQQGFFGKIKKALAGRATFVEDPEDIAFSRQTTNVDAEPHNLQNARTISRVPGNPNYYEKDGLRTYGDAEDHDHEPKMTWRRWMVLVAMGFLWTGSQIPLYLFGGIIPHIIQTLGGADRYVWIPLGNLIPIAVVTPFVGALSDLLGRRNMALVGSVFLIVGNIVCGTAHSMNVFIGGMVLNGVAAGILEMIALAVAGEIAPTKKRGIYVGGMVFTIIPYCPSVLYAQLVSVAASWRWVALWMGLWALVGFMLTFLFYWPPPRVNSTGLSRREVFKRVDYVGGLLSAAGLTLFLAGLTWGGNQYSWGTAHVLAPLIIGAVLCVAFVVWEFITPHPMFPGRLNKNKRPLYVIMIITFVSGANFFAVLVFWPTQYEEMYSGVGPTTIHQAVVAGLGSLPVGFGIIGGAVIVSILVSLTKGNIRIIMFVATVVMTVGNGCIALAKVDDYSFYASVTFACLGVGAVIVPNQIIASIVCPDDLIGAVTAMTISVRVIGGAIAYSIYYNIIKSRFTTAVNDTVVLTLIEIGIYNLTELTDIATAIGNYAIITLEDYPELGSQEGVDAVLESSKYAWQYAYQEAYYVSIAFGGVAIIASLFLPNLKKYMDGHVAVQYH